MTAETTRDSLARETRYSFTDFGLLVQGAFSDLSGRFGFLKWRLSCQLTKRLRVPSIFAEDGIGEARHRD